MPRGKSLKIFLLDGEATGRWTCVLSGRTTKAYKIPRAYYKQCSDIDELRSTAVYLLFGVDEETDRPVVYIGETEDAIERLGQHYKNEEKSYWNDAVVFISQDEHFNKAHIKYLESRFYEIAKEVDRYKVMNAKPPTKSSIAIDEQAEMEDFIDNARVITLALGYKVFEALLHKNIDETVGSGEQFFYITNRNGVSAKGINTAEGFVVCKGSVIKVTAKAKSMRPKTVKLREQYLADGTIVDGKFTRDTLFESPSAASDFVLGNNTSGPREWKNEKGQSMRDVMALEG